MQIETEKNEINDRLKNSINQNEKLQNEIIELKAQILQLKGQLQDKEKYNSDLENEVKKLKEKLENKYTINGNITARIKSGLLINGKINLIENGGKLNTNKSKYIISIDNSKTLGENAYNKGMPITSLNQTTVDFGGKPGTYYIRAIVFDTDNNSIEFVSNGVTTSGDNIAFEYTGESSTVLLTEGKYKLEVWGAQGGDSTGDEPKRSSQVNGGLGGYSFGTLSLTEPEKLYIVVGGEGKPGKSVDGSNTKGGFPDGGSAKTGLYSNFTTVPGSGGGSTSIRIKTDSIYSRVIVAGGGGGASGCGSQVNHGGSGGGICGCNCFYEGNIKDGGAGTQIGSAPGYGTGSSGNAGEFGQGATNNYCKGHATGGGGGGGWYGGGSGGHGSDYCSSGGGGSGWIFTESNFTSWNEGDPSKACQFQLDNKYYLLNAFTFAGNQQFNSIDGKCNEVGHHGNGFAKITPQSIE